MLMGALEASNANGLLDGKQVLVAEEDRKVRVVTNGQCRAPSVAGMSCVFACERFSRHTGRTLSLA
jgi:hypothetical protein